MKGSIDIVTLVIVMVPMSIFLIIGGQRLSKAAIDTDLQSSYDVGTEKFKSQNKIHQILNYREKVSKEPLYEKIVRLPVSNNYRNLKREIERKAKGILDKDTGKYYEFIVKYPNGSQLKTSTSPIQNRPFTLMQDPSTRKAAEVKLPSPKEEFIQVSVRVSS